MSLCTLPAPVSPEVFGISPAIDVALFVTGEHLILCRRSGQQVWSSRLPASGARPVKLEWSKYGELVAVLYEDGSMVAYDADSGRTKMRLGIKSGISSVAWSERPVRDPSREDHSHKLPTSIDWWTSEGDQSPHLAAVGKESGDLSIRIHGSLVIDDINISNSDISLILADENKGEYAAVSGSTMNILHIQLDRANKSSSSSSSSRDFTTTAPTFALASRLMEEVWENVAKVDETIKAMQRDNSTFFRSLSQDQDDSDLNIKVELCTMALTGYISSSVDEWIKNQHEQGFKKWYKALSQSWDFLKHTLIDKLIEQTGRLILTLGELSTDSSGLQELLKAIYKLILVIETRQPMFEREATFIEYCFSEEISRPISVTKLGKVDLALVIEDLSTDTIMGMIQPTWGPELVACAARSRNILNNDVHQIRQELRSQLELKFSFDVGGLVNQILACQNGGYCLIVNSNQLLEVDPSSGKTSKSHLNTTGNVLLNVSGKIILLGVDKNSHELVIGTTRMKLDFEPVAVTARHEESTIIACVLSEDCQHYQFVEVPKED